MSDSQGSMAEHAGGRSGEAADRPSWRRYEMIVHGRVQGVGFRWFVSRAASRLELHGWVVNASDGSVHVVAEGPAAALDALLAIVERGPIGADVEWVDVSHGQATGSLQGFEIRSGSHPGD